MARDVEATVREVLPRALYRVTLSGGADGHDVTAHLTAGPRRNFVRLLVGDRVVVTLSPGDLGRGRIVRKL